MYLKVLITISILIIVLLNIYYINFYKIFLIKSNIKVFLINLDYRKDRLERFKRTYNLKNFKCYLVKAVDAKKIDIKKLKNNNLIGNYGLETLKKTKRTHHHQFNTMGAIGCYLSHIKTWQEIMKSDCKYGLILLPLETPITINPKSSRYFAKSIAIVEFDPISMYFIPIPILQNLK